MIIGEPCAIEKTYKRDKTRMLIFTKEKPRIMSRFISQSVQNLRPSGIRRYFDIAATMDDVVTLGIGEPNFVTPQHVMDAGINSLHAGHTGYTSNSGFYELR